MWWGNSRERNRQGIPALLELSLNQTLNGLIRYRVIMTCQILGVGNNSSILTKNVVALEVMPSE